MERLQELHEQVAANVELLTEAVHEAVLKSRPADASEFASALWSACQALDSLTDAIKELGE